ncbi:MAG: hypothetical protein R3E83_02030 [Burkholderiaceae bacterium]
MNSTDPFVAIRAAMAADEATMLTSAVAAIGLDADARRRIEGDACALVEHVRAHESGLLETLMTEYGLSDDEGWP